MTSMWIGDETSDYKVGQTGFLVETSNAIKQWEYTVLRDHPAKTNQSFEARLFGWCGTYNDVATYGQGVGRVERVARNGRAFVKVLEGDEARAVLEELGYPDIASELED